MQIKHSGDGAESCLVALCSEKVMEVDDMDMDVGDSEAKQRLQTYEQETAAMSSSPSHGIKPRHDEKKM